MEITGVTTNKTLTIVLEGELDHYSAEKVRKKADMLIQNEKPNKLVFDMKGVTFMDSSGIGVILGRYRAIAKNGGELDIINAVSSIEKVLKMSGIYRLCRKEASGAGRKAR